jgi:O-antigen/teichoic acid export membrane protein
MYSTILKNTGFISLARLSQPLFSLFLIIIIAHTYGPAFIGNFEIVLSLLAVFQTIASFGFKFYLTREVAIDPTKGRRYLYHSLICLLPIGVLASLAMYITACLLHYSPEILAAVIIGGLTLLATAITEICEGIFIGIENPRYYTLICSVENIVRVGCSILAVRAGYGLSELMLVMGITRLLAVFLNLYTLHKLLAFSREKIEVAFIRHVFHASKVFALTITLAAIYGRLDILILSQMRGLAEVGIYSVAFKFIAATQLLIYSFSNSLYPFFSRLYQQHDEQLGIVFHNIIYYLLIFTIIVTVMITMLSEKIIIFCLGSQFNDSIIILQVMSISLVPYAIKNVASFAMLSSYHQINDLKINIYVLIVTIILNIFLIFWHGAVGAAIAFVLSNIIYNVFQYYYISHHIFHFKIYKIIYATVTVAMFVVIFLYIMKK